MSFVPGQNLLNMAMTMIARQGLTYYQAIGRALNSVGQYVTAFDEGSIIYGSWQPVPRNLIEMNGLDLQKNYFTFYTSNDVLDLNRNITADQVAFNGQLYQVESENDWYQLDGWKGILCVYIGPDINERAIFGFNTDPSSTTYTNFEHGNFLDTGTE